MALVHLVAPATATMATVATDPAVAVQTVEMASRSAVVGLEVEGSQGLVAVDPAGQVGREAVAQVAAVPVAMVRGGKDVAVGLAAADRLLPRHLITTAEVIMTLVRVIRDDRMWWLRCWLLRLGVWQGRTIERKVAICSRG